MKAHVASQKTYLQNTACFAAAPLPAPLSGSWYNPIVVSALPFTQQISVSAAGAPRPPACMGPAAHCRLVAALLRALVRRFPPAELPGGRRALGVVPGWRQPPDLLGLGARQGPRRQLCARPGDGLPVSQRLGPACNRLWRPAPVGTHAARAAATQQRLPALAPLGLAPSRSATQASQPSLHAVLCPGLCRWQAGAEQNGATVTVSSCAATTGTPALSVRDSPNGQHPWNCTA